MTGTKNALFTDKHRKWKLRISYPNKVARTMTINMNEATTKEQAELEGRARFPFATVEVIDE